MQKCGSRTERWRWFLPQRELRCAVLTWNNVLQRVWHADWPKRPSPDLNVPDWDGGNDADTCLSPPA